MIGADDFASFYDPDEFGGVVTIQEPGKPDRDVAGIFGAPQARGGVFRGGIDPGTAQVRVRPEQVQFQMSNADLPQPYHGVPVSVSGEAYVIAEVSPIGRFRSLVTMTPAGVRESKPAGELGKWAVSK